MTKYGKTANPPKIVEFFGSDLLSRVKCPRGIFLAPNLGAHLDARQRKILMTGLNPRFRSNPRLGFSFSFGSNPKFECNYKLGSNPEVGKFGKSVLP